jgi:beta-amylase
MSPSVFRLLTWLMGLSLVAAPIGGAAPRVPVTTAAVMAPLRMSKPELAQFDRLLGEAKAIGVTAVSVDVWWGLVQNTGNDQFNWEYYERVFEKIQGKGLKIIPIMAFHQCGGGPGDDCHIPVPGWVWGLLRAEGVSPDELKYESETGTVQDDAVPPWASEKPAVRDQFRKFIEAFAQHFEPYAGELIEINISLGPTGELRYPAYNKSDGWQYPDRGNFQAYSRLAQESFRAWALARYGDLSGVSRHWGLALGSRGDIRPPGGELPDDGIRRAQAFVDAYDYKDTPYGWDFIEWYHESLLGHGKRVLLDAHQALDGPMQAIPLGMKIPGIHWQLQCTPHPRMAEVTAGLIPTNLNQQAHRPEAFGYRKVMEMIAEVNRSIHPREVILHFTALEMDNDAHCGIGNGGTSMAAALVLWVSQAAAKHGITHRGENALGCVGDEDLNTDDNRSWGHIENAFTHASYSGFTLLRMTSRRDEWGCVPWNAVDKERYRTFIQRYVSPR